MSGTTASLQRKIDTAGDLQSVVRAMKALAASNIDQYEKSVQALADYFQTVEQGLGASIRQYDVTPAMTERKPSSRPPAISAIVFGSDQGLVGQFNDIIAQFAVETLTAQQGKCQVWAVGERVYARLADAGLSMVGLFKVPNAVEAIAPLVGEIQIQSHTHRYHSGGDHLWVFHNRPHAATFFEPTGMHLLPLDAQWRIDLTNVQWPGPNLPEMMNHGGNTLSALIHEYLFISLFQACAESLASENKSRLAAMERADKNINELLVQLHSQYHQLRQNGIDEELFDVISGFEALTQASQQRTP